MLTCDKLLYNSDMNNYSDTDLTQLHEELLSILKEIVRICKILDIKCFVTGGTAIGAYYYQGFVKWDDDIDLGMWRDDYEKFIKEAPSIISKGFFVQCAKTEPNTPFYFTKVRKDNTLFVQQEFKDVKMHHGIFVDIFPFDNIPNKPIVAKIHTRLVQYLHGSFFRRQRKQAILEGLSFLPNWLSKPFAAIHFAILKIIPVKFFYRRLKFVSSLYNKKDCQYVDVIVSSVDRMPSDSINNLASIKFEGIDVWAPKDLKGYLKNHYPKLESPDMLESLWINHAPYKISFSNQ